MHIGLWDEFIDACVVVNDMMCTKLLWDLTLQICY